MKERIYTGTVLIFLFALPFYFGSYFFILLCLLLGLIGFYEFSKMNNLSLNSIPFLLGSFVTFMLILPQSFVAFNLPFEQLFGLLLLSLLTLTVFMKDFSFVKAGSMMLGIFYIGYGFSSIVESRLENGLFWTLAILLIIWTTDSGAYFIGKKFGRNKLMPSISPNKTREGFFGGIIIGLLASFSIQFFQQPFDTYIHTFLFGIVISISAQFGDLVESAMKRHFGVKDSGHIFPGHGGVLDRTDSWLFVFIGLNLLGLL